jgi:nucleotide-binding universal stress UspA family protein
MWEDAMIKTILIPVSTFEANNAAFRTGLNVARLFDSHMEFLHVGIDPVEVMAAAMTSADGGGIGPFAGEWLSHLESEAKEQAEKARSAVEDFCQDEGIPFQPGFDASRISASWHSEKGLEDRWVPIYGREAELVVAARASFTPGVLVENTSVLASVIFETGRPLLIPASGQSHSPLETAVIAWKPTREAARALGAATPLLERCKRIVVVSVREDGRDDTGSVDRLVVALSRHGAPVDAQTIASGDGEPVDALLNVASNLPGPFIVMGAYGHSRMRETIFGGFTQRILRDAALPVLMAH